MQGNVDDSCQYGEDTVGRVETLFEFEVLVPEWVSEEVEPNAICRSLVKPARTRLGSDKESSGITRGANRGEWVANILMMELKLQVESKTNIACHEHGQVPRAEKIAIMRTQ